MSGTEVASKIGDAFCELGQVVLFKVRHVRRRFLSPLAEQAPPVVRREVRRELLRARP